MALPASGAISLNQVNVELGNSGTAQIDMNSAAVRGLFDDASGQIAMSQGYGKSNETILTSAGNVNGQAQRQQITVSSFISSGGTLVIPSTIWVWSDSTSTAALTIDIPCTIRNEGKVIGRGGSGTSNAGGSGGPAIKINSGVTGVTIQNQSGAYVAGGGGAGRTGYQTAYYPGMYGGGGGGAGGGSGGGLTNSTGGALNATGANGAAFPAYWGGTGGGSGGGGGFGNHYNSNNNGGGAGGRILPGSGGTGAEWSNGGNGLGGGPGGSAGAAGTNAGTSGGWVVGGGGGGGGWGAAGGLSNTGAGASGGKAVDDSGVTYTLSNSGTIYGAT